MEYLTHIITFITGLGAGWSLKIIVSRRSFKRSAFTSQKNNYVGGDMAGGDIHKK